jgi:hypothetical protein
VKVNDGDEDVVLFARRRSDASWAWSAVTFASNAELAVLVVDAADDDGTVGAGMGISS